MENNQIERTASAEFTPSVNQLEPNRFDSLLARENAAIFMAARRQYFTLKSEWQSLGFWARIWRARQYRVRLELIMAVAIAHDPRRLKRIVH